MKRLLALLEAASPSKVKIVIAHPGDATVGMDSFEVTIDIQSRQYLLSPGDVLDMKKYFADLFDTPEKYISTVLS